MANTTNFGWETPDDTDLVKDGAAAMRTLGSAIDTSMMDLKGGTSGQILSKNSNTDMDFVWIANDQGDITGVTASSPLTGGGTSGAITVGIQDGTTAQKGAVQLTDSTSSTSTTTAATPNSVKSAYDLANGAIPKTLTTTTGDIIYASSANTPARLAIGSSTQVLTVSGGVPVWATPAATTPTFVGVSCTNSSNQSLSADTWTAITFNSEEFDTNNFHSTTTNTSRITIPTGKGGYYLISGIVAWDPSNSGAQRNAIYVNGVNTDAIMAIQDVVYKTFAFSYIKNLSAGDYIQLYGYSSVAFDFLTSQAKFQVQYLGA